MPPYTSSGLFTPFLTGSSTTSGGSGGSSGILPSPIITKKYWKVVHKKHDGTLLGEEYPQSPEFAMYLGKTGYLTYELDRSSSLAKKETCEPYATDYDLYFDKRLIQSGMHTDIEASDLEDHTFKISGKDWYHWFELQYWPFDPANPLANVYTAAGVDIFTIFEYMLTVIQSFPDTIQFTFNNGTAGQVTNFKIDANDNESMLSKFTTLSQANPSFDFEITPDKKVKLYYPQKVHDNTQVLEIGSNIFGLEYHNKGPGGTYLLATGQGISSNLGVIVQDVTARAKYRRIMKLEDMGTLNDQTQLNSKATAEMARLASPGLEFTVKLIPDFVDEFFTNFALGDKIHIQGDIGWVDNIGDTINDQFRLVSIVGSLTDEGDEEYELGFDDGSLSL